MFPGWTRGLLARVYVEPTNQDERTWPMPSTDGTPLSVPAQEDYRLSGSIEERMGGDTDS